MENRDLLIVDNVPLRQRAFDAAAKILKKIDNLEADYKSFHELDQSLYNDWYELSFRAHRLEVESLAAEFRNLAQFYNWILAASEIMHISLPEALHFLRQQERDFQQGSELDRQKITRERQLYDDFIRAEVHSHLGDDDYGAFRDEDDEERDTDEPDEEEDKTKSVSEELQQLADMDDHDIRQFCKNKETAIHILDLTLGLAASFEDYKLFLRVWELTPKTTQALFTKSFERKMDVSLKDVIAKIRKTIKEEAAAKEDSRKKRMTEKVPVRPTRNRFANAARPGWPRP